MVNAWWIVALAVCCALGELGHLRRIHKARYLAFGPVEHPLLLARVAAALRVVAVSALAWGLSVLYQLSGATTETKVAIEEDKLVHHLVVALDVSPSMFLEDAGPSGGQTRAERARDLIRSIIERTSPAKTRVSIIAFYTTARPVVIDTYDPEVTRNILQDLPLEHAFKRGKTRMYSAVEIAAEIGREWPLDSASFILVSDGDTLPAEKAPRLPSAYAGTMVVGVGNPFQGAFIDGHVSRQDSEALNRLALRLNGAYHDGNERHLVSAQLGALTANIPEFPDRDNLQWRDAALLAVLVGSMVLAFLPPLLALLSGWYHPAQKRNFAMNTWIKDEKIGSAG